MTKKTNINLIKITAVFLSVWLIISCAACSYSGEINIYPPEKGLTRVMSFNLHCNASSEKKEKAAALISRYYPDSIGLQECTYEWYLLFKEKLPYYGFVGIGRDTGTLSSGCGETSGILYRKDKYTVVESGNFWLSDTPDLPSKGWDANCIRICTWAVLKNRWTGEKYVHINTHLDHKGSEAREKGLRLVLDKTLGFDCKTVLTGDFNFTEKSSLFTNDLNKSGLIYTRFAATETMNGMTYHANDPDNHESPYIIDYIFVNNKVDSVKKYMIITDRIDDVLISDHYPVLVDMQL